MNWRTQYSFQIDLWIQLNPVENPNSFKKLTDYKIYMEVQKIKITKTIL